MAKGTVNKIILIGRLGRDPEVKHTASGSQVANLSIATNDGYKDKQTGQFVENTDWHRVSVFGKTAEAVSKFTQKGSVVYVEGKLKTRKYTDKSNVEKTVIEIIAGDVQFISGNKPKEEDNTFF